MHDKGVPGDKGHTDLSMECLAFFAKLPTVWLTPAENISTLQLYSDDYWGYYPKVGIEKTAFPNLQTLVLGKFCFSHDSKLQWLLKHASSLQKLCLVDCSIVREDYFLGDQDEHGNPSGRPRGTYQRPHNYDHYWSSYFTEMSWSLRNLALFVMCGRKASAAPCSSWEALPSSLMDQRYLRFRADGSYFPCTDQYGLARAGKEQQWKEDWEALASLLEITTARSSSPALYQGPHACPEHLQSRLATRAALTSLQGL